MTKSEELGIAEVTFYGGLLDGARVRFEFYGGEHFRDGAVLNMEVGGKRNLYTVRYVEGDTINLKAYSQDLRK